MALCKREARSQRPALHRGPRHPATRFFTNQVLPFRALSNFTFILLAYHSRRHACIVTKCQGGDRQKSRKGKGEEWPKRTGCPEGRKGGDLRDSS